MSNAAELIALLPEVPSARFLRALTIACPVSEDEFDFSESVAELAKVLPKLPLLRRLTLGDFESEESELSWSHLGDAKALWPHLGKLEYLKIHAGSFTLNGLTLPSCRELRIETGGLDKASMKAVMDASWPHLETLNLWFGQDEYGGDCELGDVALILAGQGFPKLAHLGLANSTFGDELCQVLATSKVLPTLKSLDLSMSHLTLKGIEALAAVKVKLGNLEQLDVSRCLLDAAGVKLAKTLAKRVETSDQSDASDYEDDDYRYCAVGE